MRQPISLAELFLNVCSMALIGMLRGLTYYNYEDVSPLRDTLSVHTRRAYTSSYSFPVIWGRVSLLFCAKSTFSNWCYFKTPSYVFFANLIEPSYTS